jgi:transketolase
MNKIRAMRDVLIDMIYKRMGADEGIVFLSGDMGAPALDKIRERFPKRFINMGIAEQNLVNVASGLALEGYCVFGYMIAPFVLRAYEQIRINLAISGQVRPVNVNLIGVGCGVSYDVSGPTHHCLEDITAFRALPNVEVACPSDWVSASAFGDYMIGKRSAKYIRLDGKPQQAIYDVGYDFDWNAGFEEVLKGKDVCLISTGYMTQKALAAACELKEKDIHVGLIDILLLEPFDREKLYDKINSYHTVVTIEEGFLHRGGLDMAILDILNRKDSSIHSLSFGFENEYSFKFGNREFFYNENGCGQAQFIRHLENLCGMRKIS